MSAARMSRYLQSCDGNTKKAMTLYRQNLRLSQELFTIISCFEITLRNAINDICIFNFGNDWLKHAASKNGIFDNQRCYLTAKSINDTIIKLNKNYSHDKLIAEMGFGFWRYLFAQYQFNATKKILLKIFTSKPSSSSSIQYNQNFVFNQLAQINKLRNRIAHHEPICFSPSTSQKDTTFVRQHYVLIKQLFQWMNVDESALLYGIDHVTDVCNKIDNL